MACASMKTHPLEPLSMEEISRAAAVVRRELKADQELRFESIELKEPAKAAIRKGEAVPREAKCHVHPANGTIGVYVCVVSLSDDTLVSNEHLPNARPMIHLEEFDAIEAAVKVDPAFIAACEKRGVKNMDLVMMIVNQYDEHLYSLITAQPDEAGKHIAHTFAWIRLTENDNLYAHPIEGVCAVIDISKMEVIRVDDHGLVPVPQTKVNFDREFQEKTRTDLRPILITQPEGVSFQLHGSQLSWINWSLVVGFSAREGLILHDVKFAGRPVLYRASIAEMVVPYGTPDGGHYRKNVFDIGEYGVGRLANALELGCDCVGAIAYLDAFVCDWTGEPRKIANAVCIHEEDTGILWKHFDFRTERTEVRRGRRLVLQTISTVGNYDYAFVWYLNLDGTIAFETKATGIINTSACIPGQGSKYGTEVAPGVFGHIHQHVFCARLDVAIDGDENAVLECDTHAEPVGPHNPYGNAYYVKETALETDTGRKADPSSMRYWKFVNTSKKNWVGKPTAYKLESPNVVTPFVQPYANSGRRAAFVQNALWVTQYDPNERYPTGDFVNHCTGNEGIAAYAAKGRPTQGEDIVVWHTFGLHHQPRMEDFPVQPVIKCGFELMPSGFFDTNPCLDLPYDKNEACTKVYCNGHANGANGHANGANGHSARNGIGQSAP